MATLDELKSELDRLYRRRSAGTRRVDVGGRSVLYGTDQELAAAIADLESRIAAAEGRRVNQVRISTSKGL